MAFTVSKSKESVVGDMRFQVLDVTADAATQAVDSGLNYIYGVSMTPQSMASGNHSFRVNVDTVGGTSNGTLAVTGVASGDQMYVTVWGR
tara:strand:- start:4299 stop:4568 length:270 start_codon:yes stop_codon:yes gene_type:complete